MKTIFKIIIAFVALATISNCSKDEDGKTPDINKNIAINPDSGQKVR